MTSGPSGGARLERTPPRIDRREKCARAARSRSAREPHFGEHAFVFPEHHVPPVLAPHVVAPVSAHRGAQAIVPGEQRETLDEFVPVLVKETRVALQTVLDEYLASG